MTPCSILGIKAVLSFAKNYSTSMERWFKAGLSQITYIQEMSWMNRVVTCNTRAVWYTEAAIGVAKLPGLLIMFLCLELELVPKIRLAWWKRIAKLSEKRELNTIIAAKPRLSNLKLFWKLSEFPTEFLLNFFLNFLLGSEFYSHHYEG